MGKEDGLELLFAIVVDNLVIGDRADPAKLGRLVTKGRIRIDSSQKRVVGNLVGSIRIGNLAGDKVEEVEIVLLIKRVHGGLIYHILSAILKLMWWQNNRKRELSERALRVRRRILEMVYRAGEGHFGGPLSVTDILVVLRFGEVFDWGRDEWLMSAGHLAPAVYGVLIEEGKLKEEEVAEFGRLGARVQGHLSRETPGVTYGAGLLGQGLSVGLGMALGDPSRQVIVVTTDGEHQEGQTWEAISLAAKYRVGNLINIVDRNRMQIDGSTEEVMPLGDLGQKYLVWGWRVFEADGHDLGDLRKKMELARRESDVPVAIIAKTIMGKGIREIEDNYHYHDIKGMTERQYKKWQEELR